MFHVNTEREFGTGTLIRLLLCLCQFSMVVVSMVSSVSEIKLLFCVLAGCTSP